MEVTVRKWCIGLHLITLGILSGGCATDNSTPTEKELVSTPVSVTDSTSKAPLTIESIAFLHADWWEGSELMITGTGFSPGSKVTLSLADVIKNTLCLYNQTNLAGTHIKCLVPKLTQELLIGMGARAGMLAGVEFSIVVENINGKTTKWVQKIGEYWGGNPNIKQEPSEIAKKDKKKPEGSNQAPPPRTSSEIPHPTPTPPAGTGTRESSPPTNEPAPGAPSASSSEHTQEVEEEPLPEIHEVVPVESLSTGGTLLTIRGVHFRAGLEVHIQSSASGERKCTQLQITPTQIRCRTPALSSWEQGTFPLYIVNRARTIRTAEVGIRYLAPPRLEIRGIWPNHGPRTGGTELTINGSEFREGIDVMFESEAGREYCTSVRVRSITELTCTTSGFDRDFFPSDDVTPIVFYGDVSTARILRGFHLD